MSLPSSRGCRASIAVAAALFCGVALHAALAKGEDLFNLAPITASGDWQLLQTQGGEQFGAERLAAEGIVPSIAEPMVFDLVRPLGASRGELEVNVLALFPLKSDTRGTNGLPDPLGLIQRSPDRQSVEWAPEVELALWDGFAVEFEVPFEAATLEAYKFAAQYTFGTALDDRFIHGMQVIVQYDKHSSVTMPTGLYLMGIRIDEVWSVLAMVGFRSEIGADAEPAERNERLLNVTLFADLTERLTAGFETNYAAAMNGRTTLLLMPQFHWEITDRTMLQFGAGANFTADEVLPLAGLRAIVNF